MATARESESKIHLFLSLGGEARFIINKKSIAGKAMGGLGLEIGAALSGQVSDYALRRVAIKNDFFSVKIFHLSTSSGVKWSLTRNIFSWTPRYHFIFPSRLNVY